MSHDLYYHFKGGTYRWIAFGHHSETQEPVVIYQTVNTNEFWVRPAHMWNEEVMWPDGQKRPRFIPAK